MLRLSVAATYSGSTTIGNGTLQLGNNNRLPSTTAVTVVTGAFFDVNGKTQMIGSLAGGGTVSLGSGALTTGGNNSSTIFSGVIGGTGSVTKQGTGSMTLSGGNSYSGGTEINFGTLQVSNASGSATGSGPVNVDSGATIGGIGTIAGPVINNGTVAPGASAGTLHLLGAYTQFAGGIMRIELESPSSFDKLQVGGSVSLDGDLEISLLGGYVPGFGAQFDILDFASVTGEFSSITLPVLRGGLQWDTSQLYTSGVLSVDITGDYNGNNVVDAADYVVWRKRGGSADEYNLWRSQFGQAVGSQSEVGAAASLGVPEPHASLLVIVAFCLINATWRLRSLSNSIRLI